jgi:capsular exopolysaccharide synthesis family protein
MELRHYISIVWKWIWLIILAAGIAAVSSFLWNSRLPKIYQASTSLLVGQSLANPNPNSGDMATSQQLALTYIQIAKTEPVLQGVIDALQLKMSVDQLGNNVSASIVYGTQLIELRVVDTDPRRAQAIANEFARQLISQAPSSRDTEETSRREFVQKQAADIRIKIEDAQKKIAELQASINAAASAREIADKQQQIATLQGQINQWQLTFATLLNTLAPQASNYLSVVEPAKLPTSPIAPNVSLSVLLAAAIGMVLALAGVFLIEYLDDTIKTADDVSRSLGLSNLGAIANIWGANPSERLVASKHPRASHSEAYRTLRTNIQVMNLDKPMRTLLITSANPREGKSITSANLAVIMALGGLRVLLVDADMRRPQQHKLFRLSNEFGLVNALINPEATLETYLRPTETENLWVLTTGPIPPNPAELLDSKRMLDLVERFKDRFDLIMFDTPPILPRIDAAIMARHVDGVILVVDAGHSRVDSVKRAKEALVHAGGRILGVVLNRIEHGSYYYYYYYSDNDKSKSALLMSTSVGRAFRNVLRRIGLSKDGTLQTTRQPLHSHDLR